MKAIGWTALVLTLVTATNASAQSEREALERARALMERGQELYIQERYLEAAAEFLGAHQVRPFSAFLYNAGIAYERHGDAAHAISSYEDYLEAEPNATDSEDVRGRLTRLRGALSALAPQGGSPTGENPTGEIPTGENPTGEIPTGENPTGEIPAGEVPTGEVPTGEVPTGENPTTTLVAAGPTREMKSMLSVETNPGDARITLRQGTTEVASGPTPFDATLDAGRYEISVEHPDYQTITHQLVIRPGKVYVAILEMSQGEFVGLLNVVTTPPGASIFIDDHDHGAMGQTPFQNVVGVGEHHIWIERPGYQTIERDIEVNIGDSVTEQFTLERVAFGRVLITANVPGAVVFIDDERVGPVPYQGDVEPGARTITVQADDMKDWEEEVQVERGQITPIQVELRASPSRRTAWATAIFGVAAIGGGTALHFLGANLRDDLRLASEAGILSSDDSRIDRARYFTLGSYAAFGVGALMGVLSFVYFLKDGLPDSRGRVRQPRDWALLPMVDQAGAGAALMGAF